MADPDHTTHRPNVLLIVAEDHGCHLGCYGDPIAVTPRLDALAAESVLFRQAYTTQSVCSPARAAIHTGLYPHQNGQIGLATHRYSTFSRRDMPTLSGTLAAAGYRTGILGKLHINPEDRFPFDVRRNDRDVMGFQHRNIEAFAAQAEELFAADSSPFFVALNPSDAHLPLLAQQFGQPPQPLTGKDMAASLGGVDSPRMRTASANYYNCMARLDSYVGLVLDALDRNGHTDDTLVIFTSDHGYQFPRGKTTCYEGGIHVPLLVRWPVSDAPDGAGLGRAMEELVSHVDILPTALAAAGLPIPQGLPGRSLADLVVPRGGPWRSHVVSEWNVSHPPTYHPQRSIRNARYKLIKTLLPERPTPAARYYTDGVTVETSVTAAELAAAPEPIQTAFDEWAHSPAVALYDLDEDPEELENLARSPEHTSVLAELLDELERWQHETDDSLRNPAMLRRLTEENDAIESRWYRDNYRGTGSEYQWQYMDYL
jgi:N-sulfoglucosamine sulfohydrolase